MLTDLDKRLRLDAVALVMDKGRVTSPQLAVELAHEHLIPFIEGEAPAVNEDASREFDGAAAGDQKEGEPAPQSAPEPDKPLKRPRRAP